MELPELHMTMCIAIWTTAQPLQVQLAVQSGAHGCVAWSVHENAPLAGPVTVLVSLHVAHLCITTQRTKSSCFVWLTILRTGRFQATCLSRACGAAGHRWTQADS